MALKNTPTPFLLPGLPAILLPRPALLVTEPGLTLPTFFAVARLTARLGDIRCKRQEIQKRATESGNVSAFALPESPGGEPAVG